ncbi:hypothetical protein D3C87_1550560 [compost metagenome]
MNVKNRSISRILSSLAMSEMMFTTAALNAECPVGLSMRGVIANELMYHRYRYPVGSEFGQLAVFLFCFNNAKVYD